MPSPTRSTRFLMSAAICGAVAIAMTVPTLALVPKDPSPLDSLAISKPNLRVKRFLAKDSEVVSLPGQLEEGYSLFKSRYGTNWWMKVDPLTLRPALLQGQGIPMIPGTGNRLKAKEMGVSPQLAARNELPKTTVETLVRGFLDANPDLFRVEPHELVLSKIGTGPILDYLYYLRFDWEYHGIPVEGAHILFRLNHGNLVQMGSILIGDSIRNLDPTPTIEREAARHIIASYVGRMPGDLIDGGKLSILPALTDRGLIGAGHPDLVPDDAGSWLAYRLVYSFSFQRSGVEQRYEAKVDARTGEILVFRDTADYGQVHGGVFPFGRLNPESQRPLPYADTAPGTFTDASGTFSGNNATVTLAGKHVTISDACGAVSLTTTTGDADFGTSSGVNCTTPGFGGAGNTHATRTTYFHVNDLQAKARNYLPSNSWLNGNVTVKLNGPAQCNAFWDGSSLNLFKKNAACANTGVVLGVFMHEWGHGMDGNDGMVRGDQGSGESYGDTTAALQTHDSCIGRGWILSGNNCNGYGDKCTNCSGVRDVDWDKHATHIPHTADNFIGGNPNRCPGSQNYKGPCGREGHCESAIASEAIWDLANRDLPSVGIDVNSAWKLVDRLWYASRPTSGSAWACDASYQSDGCTAEHWYQTFLVADDCDGNLANGTPHMGAIYNAFNRHLIACATPTVKTQANCCPTLATPVLTATPGQSHVILTWNAVANATGYDIYRNQTLCGRSFTRIASVSVPQTAYDDTLVVNGYGYNYRVQATAGAACTSRLSNCTAVTPTPGPSARYVTNSAAFGADAGGDNDGYLDNCETATVSFQVTNDGNQPLTNVSVTVSSLSSPLTIVSGMPLNLGSLAVGASTNGNLTVALGQTAGATCLANVDFQIDVTSDQQTASSAPTLDTFRLGPVEADRQAISSPLHGFETDSDGWTLTNFSRDNSKAATGSWSLHSTSTANLSCDRASSPLFQPTSSTTVTMRVSYDIEPFNQQWWDRANVHVVEPASGVHTQVMPAGETYGSGADSATLCHISGETGWAGKSTGWPGFTTATFNLSAFAGKTVYLEVNYNTDEGTVGTGFWVDHIQFSAIRLVTCDTQSCGNVSGAELVTGYGPKQSSPPVWTAWKHDYVTKVAETAAYGSGYGANVGGGNIDGGATEEILSGPGPSPANGPHVRGFRASPFSVIQKINYFAYGTLKFGVGVSTGDLDIDGFDEILTGAGPGAVFGPHVRGWNFDGSKLTSMKKISFFAYNTLKFGVLVSSGNFNVSQNDEILTGSGPSGAFGPQIRGFDYTAGNVASISGINYFAYATGRYGVRVSSADVDNDGYSEIVAGRGPDGGTANDTQVKAFDYDNSVIAGIFSITPFAGTLGGALVAGGNLDGSTLEDEVVVSHGGFNTSANADVVGVHWDLASGATTIPPNFVPYTGDTYGATLALVEIGDF